MSARNPERELFNKHSMGDLEGCKQRSAKRAGLRVNGWASGLG